MALGVWLIGGICGKRGGAGRPFRMSTHPHSGASKNGMLMPHPRLVRAA
jgi:hypothetical protein